jgi:hypothetical protein
VSHSYQTYLSFPGSDLSLDCGLRDHGILILDLLLFSFYFRVYLYYLDFILIGHHISPHKGSIRVYFSLESL